MTAKTAKIVKTAKAAKVEVKPSKKNRKVEAQLPAVELPAAQLPAATAKVKEQPMWQGKPISAAGLVYHQRREAGVCVKCGKPLAEGSKLLCDAHLAYHNKWHGDRKQKAAQAQLEADAAKIRVAELEAALAAATAPKGKTRKSK